MTISSLWPVRCGAESGETMEPPRSAAGASPPTDLLSLDLWKRGIETCRGSVAQFIGRPLQHAAVDSCAEPCSAAEISLTLRSSSWQLVLGIAAGSQTMRTVAHAMLGETDPPAALLEDVLREMTNGVAGALKFAAHDQGVAMTLGLPACVPLASVASSATNQPLQVATFSNPEDQTRITVFLRARQASVEWVAVGRLSEGMVLVRNVCNTHGEVLEIAGTRLTSSTVEHIQSFLGPTESLEVIDVPAPRLPH